MAIDPYAEFLSMAGGSPGPVGLPPALFAEGEVLRSGAGGPLQVRSAGLELEEEDLRVNPRYDWDWERDYGEEHLLRRGDRVVLLTADGEVFYLLCKVVGAGG